MEYQGEKSLTASLRDLVRAEIRRAGVGERTFEQTVGLRRWSLRGFLDPERNQAPSLDRAQEIASALGWRLRLEREGAGGLSEPPGGGSDLARPEAMRAGFLPIPMADAGPRGGSAPLAFARGWLADHGFDPERLAMARITRSDFGARLPVGALALLDRAAPRRGGPALWCLREGPEARLAELEWLQDDMLLVSGGESAPRRLLRGAERDALMPVGRVLWIGHAPAEPPAATP